MNSPGTTAPDKRPIGSYRFLRPLLFRTEPELAHDLTIGALERVSRNRIALAGLSRLYEFRDPRLELERFGLRFPTPIGLAAGLDEDGRAVPAWQALGFGFVEVGSVTARPQPGNPRPRLFRLPEDTALVNRMGFNNRGAGELARRLAELRQRDAAGEAAGSRAGTGTPPGNGPERGPESTRRARLRIPLFVNVGKSRSVPLELAADDYREALEAIWGVADAAVLNVSSPNTPGLRSLQEPTALEPILALCDELQERLPRPLLLKLAPDLEFGQLTEILDLAARHSVAGLVAVNTTTERSRLTSGDVPDGGLSGAPLAQRSLDVLRFLAQRTSLPIVSVGGILSSADVIERLRAGASLVELYTGLIYRGPALVRELSAGLLAEVDREGLASVEQLIGRDG